MSKRIALAFVAIAILSAGLLFVRPPQARAGSLNAPVLLIHGYNASSGLNCDWSPMWGTVKSYFAAGATRTRTVCHSTTVITTAAATASTSMMVVVLAGMPMPVSMAL